MTTTPDLPTAGHDQAVDPAYADGVLAGQLTGSAVFLAGLLANGLLEVVGRPDRLPQDLWPSDPEVAQSSFQLGLAVGLHAGRVSAAPRLYRDQLDRVQGEFEAIGFAAMARLVGRSRRLVASHPADGETVRGRNSGVMNGLETRGKGAGTDGQVNG
ncbi:hypothetical protein ACGFNY_44215 [Streptomyces chartreusis]|uniref:hypothetical protein n=1 Tax=Streptomyces chartreusis TaxID=1969 RepID=UPI0037192A9F